LSSSIGGRYLTTLFLRSFDTQSLAGRTLVDQHCNDNRKCNTTSGLLTEMSATLLDDFLTGHVNEGGQEVFLQKAHPEFFTGGGGLTLRLYI